MTFEVGKFYKTQNGSKVECKRLVGNLLFFTVIGGKSDTFSFASSLRGRCIFPADWSKLFDVVGPWEGE